MQTIKCERCGNSGIKFGQTFINVERKTYIKCCEHCNNVKEEVKTDFFCSEKCYDDYLRDCMEHGDF